MPSLGANKALGITESGASGTCTEFLASSTTSELEWNITLQNMGSGIPTQPAESLDNTLWKYERISFPWGQFCPKENQKWNESKQRTSLLWVFFKINLLNTDSPEAFHILSGSLAGLPVFLHRSS